VKRALDASEVDCESIDEGGNGDMSLLIRGNGWWWLILMYWPGSLAF
jgi:hypothetical protein